MATSVFATSLCVAVAAAQDTTRREGVTVILKYTPGVQPGLVVLPGPGVARPSNALSAYLEDPENSDGARSSLTRCVSRSPACSVFF